MTEQATPTENQLTDVSLTENPEADGTPQPWRPKTFKKKKKAAYIQPSKFASDDEYKAAVKAREDAKKAARNAEKRNAELAQRTEREMAKLDVPCLKRILKHMDIGAAGAFADFDVACKVEGLDPGVIRQMRELGARDDADPWHKRVAADIARAEAQQEMDLRRRYTQEGDKAAGEILKMMSGKYNARRRLNIEYELLILLACVREVVGDATYDALLQRMMQLDPVAEVLKYDAELLGRV